MNETRRLAEWVVNHRVEGVPQDIVHEAKRALLNFVGVALGGCAHEATEIALKTVLPFSGPATASILGRREKCDPLHAALINGIASHVLDFDDTTPKNYIHPTSPVASALFAYASTQAVAGRDFLHAFVLGFEVTSRVGNVVYPSHYDAGWHITGTAGVFGAAAAIGKLRGLPAQKMLWAIGLAATQAAGLRDMFGSMGKAFHPGRAAQNGYFAALLAENGFTSGEHSIEGPRGFAFVQAAGRDLSRLFDRLGERYELFDNTYKPFPCGIVIHPTIDACIQIHQEHRPPPKKIKAVNLQVAPIVLDLCNKKDIKAGLEGKFSIYHAASIGLGRGRGGIEEFTDAAVNDPALVHIRSRTQARKNPQLADDEAMVEVIMEDGTHLTKHVEHAIGNIARPMTDAELEDKFRAQADRVIPRERTEQVMQKCWEIERLADCRELISLTIPA